MARPSSQATSIGLFVIAAITLFLVLFLALGSGRLFSQTVTYKLRLHTSVKGLSPGAQVKFRGVTVGQVKDISLLGEVLDSPDASVAQTTFPATITLELTPESFGFDTSWLASLSPAKENGVSATRELILKLVVEQGLQVEMKLLSMLTGQKYLEMNVSDKPLTDEERQTRRDLCLRGFLPHKMTAIDKLTEELTKQDFSRHLTTAYNVLDQLDAFVSGGGVQNMLSHLESFSANLDAASASLPALANDAVAATATVRRVAEGAEQTMAQVEATLADARQCLKDLDALAVHGAGELPALIGDLRGLAAKADAQLETLSEVLQQLQRGTADGSSLRQRVDTLLDDCGQAAGRLNTLMEMLSRDPQMLLMGRQSP